MLRTTAIMPNARAAPSDLPTLGEVLGAFDDTCACWTMRRANAVVGGVVLGGALCRFLIDRRFGAPESKVPTPVQPAFITSLERRVLEPFVRSALGALLEALEIPVDSVTLGVDTKTLSSLPGGSAVLRVAAQVTVPATGDDEVFAFFFPHAFAAPRKEPEPDVRREIAARVADAEVELSAILGRTSTTVRGLLSLQVGDVLRLDASPDSPIVVHIDEHPVLRGLPVVRRGNLAVEIVERLSVGGSPRGGRS